MALTPRSGFSVTTSGRNDIENNIPNSQSDVANNMPYVGDTMLNRFAINTSAYPNTSKLLVGFMKGKRTLVTYYRLLNKNGGSLRTNNADYPADRNVLLNEYQKITNLEITLPQGFSFEADPSKASVEISGDAKMYPGMNPNVGDVFFTAMGDGRLGVFQVTLVTPTTWRNDRTYIIRFVLQNFMDSSDVDPIEGSVTLRHIFSKTNYLGSTASLLSEQTYLDLQTIKSIRSNLIRHYHQTFFCRDINSYLRPDGVYDPYAVQFMVNKITMKDLKIRPKNLTGSNSDSYQNSLWARLEDRYNTSLYGLWSLSRTRVHRKSVLSVTANELIGYDVLELSEEVDGLTPYIFSSDFYSGSVEDMSDFELLLHEAVTLRTCGSLSVLISDYLNQVPVLTKEEQYYRIPIYLHFIDMALQSQYREIDAPDMAYASLGES